MAAGLEAVWNFRNLPEIKKRGEGKPHSAPFIGNQGSAYIAADFAGKNALVGIQLVVVEMQMIDTTGDPDITLMKYGGPLHGAPCNFLQTRQWHIFASTGSAHTSYWTVLQQQLARYLILNVSSSTDA